MNIQQTPPRSFGSLPPRKSGSALQPAARGSNLVRTAGSALAGLLLLAASASADPIAAWDFTGENGGATSTAEVYDAHLDSTNSLTRGAGAAASSGANSFRTTGFKNEGISTSNTDYFQATLSASAGYTLSLSTIDAKFNGTNTFYASPGVSAQFAYSLDGTTFTLIGSPFAMTATGAMPQIDVSGISALQNVPDTTTVTIRYFASGQTTSGGWGFYSASAGSYGLALGGTIAASGVTDTTPPALVSVSPADNSTSFLPSANLTLTYDEGIVAATGSITIKKSSDDSIVETVAVPSSKVLVSGATATINPATLLNYSTGYYVEVSAGTFTDASNNPAPAITGNAAWNFATRAAPSVVINQYYEGVGSSRFIELKNLTGSPITLDGYRLAAWSSSDPAGNQAWKSGTDTTTRVTPLDGKIIPANGYYLLMDSAATAPAYAVNNNDLAVAYPSGVSYSGTASIVLYSSATNDLASVADAVSITASEGTDTSFYRLNSLPGFDFSPGSSILSYSSTWGTKTVAQVDAALVTDDWYLQASQPPKTLALAISPSSFSEGAGAGAATATVTRSGPTDTALDVTISVSDTSEANAQSTVTIPIGSDHTTFPIDAVNDLYLDGDVQVTVSVSADGFTPGSQQITVTDELTDVPFPVVINELDCDTPSTDTAEFIELYNKSASPVSLDGVVLVLYNGASNTSYRTIDLSGQTIAAKGFFVVGNSAVANVNVTFPDGTLQNGEDAVALYLAPASAFPNGTPVTTTAGTLVDALVYGTNDPDATALLAALTPGKPQADEGANPASEAVSLSRVPDGGAAFDSSLFVTQAPTPGVTNVVTTSDAYTTWINTYYSGVTDQAVIGFNADPDGDGISNGVEALIGGNPSQPGAFTTSALTQTGNKFTFLYPQARTVPAGVTAAYQWSTDMSNWYNSGATSGDGVTVTLADVLFNDDGVSPTVDYQVTATVTAGTATKLFVRVVSHHN